MQLNNTPIEQIRPVPLFQWRQNHANEIELNQSLQKFGFITPLTGFAQGEQIFLIDGYERLGLAQTLSIQEIPIIILDVGLEEALIRRLSLNNKRWTSLELSHILNAAKTCFSDSEVAIKIAPLLNLQSTQQIDDYIQLRELPLEIKKHYGDYSLTVLKKVMDFDLEDQNALNHYIPKLTLNQNKLGELLDLLYDIRRTQKRSLDEILAEYFLDLESLEVHERADHLRSVLKKIRYPLYEEKKQKWEQIKKNIKKLHPMHIETTPFFENSELTLQTKIKNSNDLKKLVETLGKSEFNELISFLEN